MAGVKLFSRFPLGFYCVSAVNNEDATLLQVCSLNVSITVTDEKFVFHNEMQINWHFIACRCDVMGLSHFL